MMLFLLAVVAGSPFQSPDQRAAEHPTVPNVRNRGRAYLAAEKLPEAARAFRQAERLAPWDAGVRGDLAAVREFTGDVQPPASWADRLGPADVWMIAFASSFAVVAGGTGLLLTQKRRWWVALFIGFLGWLGLTFATISSGQRGPFAIVSADRVVLRTGNADSYPSRADAPLRAGQELTVLGRRGGWARVQTNAGAVGWVPDAAILFE